jgi:hypothetical protein
MDYTEIVKGQAGNRLVIKYKPKESSGAYTSHYASVEEFLTDAQARGRCPIEWYKILN